MAYISGQIGTGRPVFFRARRGLVWPQCTSFCVGGGYSRDQTSVWRCNVAPWLESAGPSACSLWSGTAVVSTDVVRPEKLEGV